MSDYSTCSNNRLVMSISNLMDADPLFSAAPTYHHQPSPPLPTVAGNSIQIPNTVVTDDPLGNPGDGPLCDAPAPWYTTSDPIASGKNNDNRQQPVEHGVKERRRRNNIASAKYRAKRNQESERLRKWIDDLRRQNAVLVRALSDVYCQGDNSNCGEKLPSPPGPGTTNDYSSHHWPTSSLSNSTFTPFY